MESIKCVVVGDGAVGKTCLLKSFAEGSFPRDHVPTVFDHFTTTVTTENGRAVKLGLWDTAGQDDFDRIRPLSYPETDVFLLCFSIVRPESFANVGQKWIQEIRHYCANAPVVLVGTKLDMRYCDEQNLTLAKQEMCSIDSKMAIGLAKKLGAVQYCECSALTQKGVKRVFDEAIRIGLQKREEPSVEATGKSGRCNLL